MPIILLLILIIGCWVYVPIIGALLTIFFGVIFLALYAD